MAGAGLRGWRAGWWRVRRVAQLPAVVIPTIARCVEFIVAEAWNEKTAVSIFALSLEEENTLRTVRAQLARWIGLERVSNEEYLALSGKIVEYYTQGRIELLTKTEACRLVTGRRRFRP